MITHSRVKLTCDLRTLFIESPKSSFSNGIDFKEREALTPP